jgi:hypothetical protein
MSGALVFAFLGNFVWGCPPELLGFLGAREGAAFGMFVSPPNLGLPCVDAHSITCFVSMTKWARCYVLVVRPVDVFIPPSLWVRQHRAFVSRVPRACRPFPAAIPQRYPNGAPAAVLELCGFGWGQWPAGRKLRTPLWSKPRLEVVSS